MTRRVKYLALAGLAMGAAWLTYWYVTREPLHNGKTATEWIVEFQQVPSPDFIYFLGATPGGDYRTNVAGIDCYILGHAPAQTNQILTGVQTTVIAENLVIKDKLLSQSQSAGYYIANLCDVATITLREMGPAAMPPLIAALGRADNPGYNLKAFVFLHSPKAARNHLLPTPISPVQTRRNAAILLGLMGPDAAAAVPALIHALEDPDRETRLASAETLGFLGASARTADSALTDKFNDPEIRVIMEAFVALDRIGANSPADIHKAVRWAQTAMPRERLYENIKVRRLGGPIAAQLVAWLMIDDSLVNRCGAIRLAGQLGQNGAVLVPDLIKLLKDDEISLRYAALDALRLLGPIAKAALPELQTLRQDKNRNLAKEAERAMTSIVGPTSDPQSAL